MVLKLGDLLHCHGIRHAELAAHLGVSRSTVTHLIHETRAAAVDRSGVTDWLLAHGVPEEEAAEWDRPLPKEVPGAATPGEGSSAHTLTEDRDMLLRRQPIHQATRRHFGLSCDPFARDLESHEDVFESPDIRYVRESMWSTARHGGLLAVVGESGSGKTTLLDDIADRIRRTGEPVFLVRPDVTGMELNDKAGKTLKVRQLQEAILADVAPLERPRISSEARARQLRHALEVARDAGQRCCLAIDEAHCLPTATLKHLKRLLEIKQGFTRLISIILLGQPELGMRLSERNPEVREVVQRCEVVTLEPLGTGMEGYLEAKLRAAGRTLAELVDASGLDALRERLQVPAAQRNGVRHPARSLAYPLAVGNLLAAAMNVAADAGAAKVARAAVMEVGR
jgi:type II secretory pathway predicted ATPase ExeA